MRFVDFFARSFASVSAPQFPWVKMFEESPAVKIADITLCHISVSVYKTSVDWIALKSPEALANFVLWCPDNIVADLANQQSATKGSKKSVQQIPSSNQVMFKYIISIFSLLPDALLSLLSKLRDNPRYQGQENLPHSVWVIAQASLGDRVVGMYLWAHYLLPVSSLSYSERAGSHGTKTRKQASQQLLPTAILAIQEKYPELTKEATDLFIWCFDSNLSSVTGSG
ncbi:unnamed protein product, partial [Musa acuminata subsp. malaccensis]